MPNRARRSFVLAEFVDFVGTTTSPQWEEGILFPLFEQKPGQTGLTRTLLAEHQEIRECLEVLSEKLEQTGADFGDEERRRFPLIFSA